MPKYDFNWQLLYQPLKPIRVPKGTQDVRRRALRQLRVEPANPNPNRTVYLGRMTWEEMMAPFFGVLIDANTDPNDRDQARTVSRLGRRCVKPRAAFARRASAPRAAALIGVVAITALTAVVSAQIGGKPTTGNPTPGTAQPDPPNLADRVTVAGCLSAVTRRADASASTVSAAAASASVDTERTKQLTVRADQSRSRGSRAGGHRRVCRDRRVEQDISPRRNRQPVLAIRRSEGRSIG